MPDYQGGKIYTIRAPETDKYYIGSTAQSLAKRFYDHKKNYKRYQNGKTYYITSYDILELEGAYIELLELYPCNSKNELERREGQLIRENRENCVNKHIAGRTIKEWVEDNKKHLKEYHCEYHAANKEQRNAKMREYHAANKETIKARQSEKINCECGASVSRRNIAQHRTSKKHQKLMDAKNE